jgi:hypothetical protein
MPNNTPQQSQRNNLYLRTGDNNDDGIGKEIFRVTYEFNRLENTAFLKINISFPLFNPQTNKNFWRWAETTINIHTAEEIIQHLRDWPDEEGFFRTGKNFTQNIRISNDWMEDGVVPAKKVVVTVPPSGERIKRFAITRINHTMAKEIIDCLEKFIESEYDREEKEEIDGNTDPAVQKLRQKIERYENQIVQMQTDLNDAKQELDDLLYDDEEDGDIDEDDEDEENDIEKEALEYDFDDLGEPIS